MVNGVVSTMKKPKILRALARKTSSLKVNEAGVTLMETVVALAILGIVAAVFLSGLSTTARANLIVDEKGTADSIARSQMEYVKTVTYVDEATTYTAAPIPSYKDYGNYSVSILAEPLNSPDDGIQKITVTVSHEGEEVISLEGYKIN